VPELPDIESYLDALATRIFGGRLVEAIINDPFVLRTATPPPDAVVGQRVSALERIGKRIAIGFENDHWLVFHLMIAGRLHWHSSPPKPTRSRLVLLSFDSGTVSLTEAGSRRRASLHLLDNRAALDALDPQGLEVFATNADEFEQRLTRRNHTLKRALTDPRILSGIGNAYSDEILHRARLSPVRQTHTLARDEFERLLDCARAVLGEWKQRLAPVDGAFPEKVTAFREGMAVHGKYGQPCPDCATTVQRIRYAANETNYCPRCQTGGRLLADRSLSRLLKSDWPKSIDELEHRESARRR
jgi:formamidopyrimidine-DNA glycosylase